MVKVRRILLSSLGQGSVPWNCSFRSTFRLFANAQRGPDLLDVFLFADGKTQEEVLSELPYDRARAVAPGTLPDPKRYRDGRQLLRTVGLLYDEPDNGTRRVRVTKLGKAVARWRPVLTENNASVLGRHVAHALSSCQLRNPTRDGQEYGPDVRIFPFAFIWRVMLGLDGTISSEELNRAVFRAHSDDELPDVVERIKKFRRDGDVASLGEETVREEAQNDRILVWMAWASFGWTLIEDKRSAGGVYRVRRNAYRLVSDAAAIKHRHREYQSEKEYVEHIAACAGVPEDLR